MHVIIVKIMFFHVETKVHIKHVGEMLIIEFYDWFCAQLLL
jgi:hypothetical protein